MVHNRARYAEIGVLLLALLVPVFQTTASVKVSSIKVKTTIMLNTPATLGDKSLAPGNYSVVADSASVRISQDGKLIAESSADWKESQAKALMSYVVLDSARIIEMHFRGKTSYLVLPR